ncbi:Regulation of nuclear pre-mRNA domain-containing protein 1B [Amphibalanus amphitrite]|uniref:Regulation of nuclear pre-mRNA domain-containing protein 1B n=1 Tax=Amphibalanus amphitrite TaxID=1232801 RepID=A0A6A4W5C4_AMPAM|nr:Regulation of nuclear pre-mRNA domain-containing protein 1B [Amphibalanus amphitrite]
MSAFSTAVFVKKLGELNNTTPSIQTLSLWLIHHRKHASTIVQTWKKEVLRAPSKKKLTMMYLANDVIQNSKKKGTEFNLAFAPELPSVYRHLGGTSLDEKTESGVVRLLNVWQERGVFTSLQISGFRTAFETGSKSPSMSPAISPNMSPDGLFKEPPPKKKKLPAKSPLAEEPKKPEAGGKPPDGPPPPREHDGQKSQDQPDQKKHHEHKKHHEERKRHEERRKSSEERRKSSEDRKKPEVKEVEVEGHKEVHVMLSPHSPVRDPPEPSELITALQDLENSASSDCCHP